jgi:hypothetical protein
MSKTSNTALNKTVEMGVVAHACNPSYLEGGDRRVTVQGQLRQKIQLDPISKNKLARFHTCWKTEIQGLRH